jgi:hypothetical protein
MSAFEFFFVSLFAIWIVSTGKLRALLDAVK